MSPHPTPPRTRAAAAATALSAAAAVAAAATSSSSSSSYCHHPITAQAAAPAQGKKGPPCLPRACTHHACTARMARTERTGARTARTQHACTARTHHACTARTHHACTARTARTDARTARTCACTHARARAPLWPPAITKGSRAKGPNNHYPSKYRSV